MAKGGPGIKIVTIAEEETGLPFTTSATKTTETVKPKNKLVSRSSIMTLFGLCKLNSFINIHSCPVCLWRFPQSEKSLFLICIFHFVHIHIWQCQNILIRANQIKYACWILRYVIWLDCYTVLAWWQYDCQWGMRHGLQLARITFLW